ncbi:MAG: hypothetical protein WDO16_13945 [Bacteroidota bacterium]
MSAGIKDAVHWVYLHGDYTLISERMKARKDHYMPESLLQSQFEALETPANAIRIDIDKKPEEIIAGIIKELSL